MKAMLWIIGRLNCLCGWHAVYEAIGEELDDGRVRRYRCPRCEKREWR